MSEREKINLKHITRTQAMRIFQVDFIIYFCFVLSVCICISYFVFLICCLTDLKLNKGRRNAVRALGNNVTALRPFETRYKLEA